MKERTEEEMAKHLEPYLYLRDHGVNTFQEYREFIERFPDCSESLALAIVSKLIKRKRGVGLFSE
jgi:hypothetical protein